MSHGGLTALVMGDAFGELRVSVEPKTGQVNTHCDRCGKAGRLSGRQPGVEVLLALVKVHEWWCPAVAQALARVCRTTPTALTAKSRRRMR